MNPKVSYTKILKVALSTVALLAVFLATLIWFFGDKTRLETEISKAPSFNQVEIQEIITSPLSSNLTEDISAVLAREIVTQNPQGPQLNAEGGRQISAQDPEALIAQTIEEGLQNFDPQELRGKIDLSKLSIVKNNTLENKADFFLKVDAIIATNFRNVALNTEIVDVTNFSAIAKAYGKTVASFYAQETPSDLQEFVIALIEAFQTQQNIYSALANFEQDPLLALLAVDFESETFPEVLAIFSEMNRYIENNDMGKLLSSNN